MHDQSYLIGDLAKEFGVTLRALRFYESRGLLSPRRRGPMRVYSAADRARLERILTAKKLGFTLTEITAMIAKDESAPTAKLLLTEEQVEAQIAYLERQHSEIVEAIAELRAMRANACAEGGSAVPHRRHSF